VVGRGDLDVRARLFVAVVPPAVVADCVEHWLLPVRAAWETAGEQGGPGGLRWTTREQWHVTLRFLGDVPLRAAGAALAAVTAPAVEARLGPRLRSLGTGVLCLPVRGLEDLAGSVASATDELGRPPDRRPFRGHLTLARARSVRRAPRRAGSSVASSADPIVERFPVGEIQLMRSTLRPSGAVYDVVARRALSR
jgi:RNA 2',3'-cyclic 3'-phosphodiesterase